MSLLSRYSQVQQYLASVTSAPPIWLDHFTRLGPSGSRLSARMARLGEFSQRMLFSQYS
jgi:hypothetical protein